MRLLPTKPEPTGEPNPGPSPAPSPILKKAPDYEGNHIKEEDEGTSSASSAMMASTVTMATAATASVPSGGGTQATADSGKIVQAIDQISIKTPNPKCRLYWCLIEFIDWRYSQS